MSGYACFKRGPRPSHHSDQTSRATRGGKARALLISYYGVKFGELCTKYTLIYHHLSLGVANERRFKVLVTNDKPLHICWKRGSELYENSKQNTLRDSGANYRVRRSSPYKRLPFPYKQHSNLPAPGDMREITLQVGVGTKAGVEICRDQEGVASDSYKSIEYLWLRGTR
ncbi:hypothetical protein EDB85DRAFT_1891778 [Lactarius pseudohatsudake]|nr:hypothetical protein EDB85DRAFT_1891778 [Lactarius pseudohatsudake]